VIAETLTGYKAYVGCIPAYGKHSFVYQFNMTSFSSIARMASFHPLLVTGAASSVAAILIVKLYRFISSTHRDASFPPGPPTVSGLGNILDMPLIKPFLKYEEWSKQYGSILGLKVGAVNLVILNDPEHARELFGGRGSRYGFRNMGYIAIKYVMDTNSQGHLHLLNMQPGPQLRLMRSVSVSFFGTSANSKVLPLVDATAAGLVHKLLDPPGTHEVEPFQFWGLATPLIAISGERLEDRGKAFVDRFFHAQHAWLHLLGPGNTPPVDVLPFLRWIPAKYAKWKRQAKEVRDYMTEEYASLLVEAKKIYANTSGRSSANSFDAILIKLLREREVKQETRASLGDDDLAHLGGGILDAAVDTTYATIRSALLLLAAHPECQAKAAEEVQRLCPDAPPSGQDLSRLEYTRSCILEVSTVVNRKGEARGTLEC
jgi:cytochrome P450